jgi:hypothetical protein
MAWCAEACSGLALLAFNAVDLVCGLVLTSYGLFLGGSALSRCFLSLLARALTVVRLSRPRRFQPLRADLALRCVLFESNRP